MLVRGENMLANYDMLKCKLQNYMAPDNKIKRMSDSGEIIKLTKDLYETDKKTPGYLVANAIYNPSYLSFDYALAYHGLIPEAVYVYTSATYKKKKRKTYQNALGTFTYRDIPSEVYPYGIKIVDTDKYPYSIATAEKALCDKLYSLQPVKNKKEMIHLLFHDLRIDQDVFENLNFDDLAFLCDRYGSTNLKILKKVIGGKIANSHTTDD